MKLAASWETVHHILIGHGNSERLACRGIQFNHCSARRPSSEDRDLLLRTGMLELAEDQRRFGSPCLHELWRREGLVQNHKLAEEVTKQKTFVAYSQTGEASKPCRIVWAD